MSRSLTDEELIEGMQSLVGANTGFIVLIKEPHMIRVVASVPPDQVARLLGNASREIGDGNTVYERHVTLRRPS